MIVMALLHACSSGNDECSRRYIDPGQKVFTIKGCLKDSLENGEWTIYDSAQRIVEQGSFGKGIRTGKWRYPGMPSADSVIEWTQYRNSRLDIATNIPRQFSPQEQGTLTAWQSSDTTQPFSIEISLAPPGDSIGLDSFYLVNEAGFTSRGWTLTRTTSKVTFKEKPYILSLYDVDTGKGGVLQVLNCYGMTAGGKVLNISVACHPSRTALAATVFSAVLSNIFVGGSRFIDPFNDLHKIMLQPAADSTSAQ